MCHAVFHSQIGCDSILADNGKWFPLILRRKLFLHVLVIPFRVSDAQTLLRLVSLANQVLTGCFADVSPAQLIGAYPCNCFFTTVDMQILHLKWNVSTPAYLVAMMLDAIFHPEDDILSFRWESNGAYPTYKSFCSLVKEKQEAILDFLSGLSLETAISCNGHTYRLVHAAPAYMFAEYNRRNWDETTFCVWYRIRKEDTVSADETLIFGHTPTYRYSHGLPVSIWHGQNRIDIDCGAGHGYGGRLACLRLDDMAEFYVDAQ